MKWQLLNTTALVRKPADETGSGGEGGEGGEGGAPGEGGGGDAGEGGNAGDPGAGDGGRKGSLLDYAPKGKQAEGGEGGEEWKLPDGVDIPEHLVGTDAETFHSEWVDSESMTCGRGLCTLNVPGLTLDSRSVNWYVRAWGEGGFSTGGEEGWTRGPSITR